LSVIHAPVGVVIKVVSGIEEAGVGEVNFLHWDLSNFGDVSPLRFRREGIFPAIRKAFCKSFTLVELANELRDVVVVNAVAGMIGMGGDGVAGILASDGIELAEGDFVLPHPKSTVLVGAPAEDDAIGIDPFASGLSAGSKLKGKGGRASVRGIVEKRGELGRKVIAFRENDGRRSAAFLLQFFQDLFRFLLVGVDEGEAFGGDALDEEVKCFFDLLAVEIVLTGDAESSIDEGFFEGVTSTDDERNPMSGVRTCRDED